MKRKISILDHKELNKAAEPATLFAKATKDLKAQGKAVKGNLEEIVADFDSLRADRRAKRISDSDFIGKVKGLEERLAAHVERRKAYEEQHTSVVNAITGLRDAQDKEISAHFDRMHGLLSYAIATRNDVPGVMRCLFGELTDYKSAKTREERAGIAKTIRIVLDSDEIKRVTDEPKQSVLADYNRIVDPAERNRFYTAHRDEILAAHDAETFDHQPKDK